MTSKRIILGVGVVAAIGVVFAFWSGLVPPKSGLEGTIGAAQRYQSGQITDKDVVLQDQQLQALLQSDVFHKLQTDPAYEAGFRAVVNSKAFEEAAKAGDFTELDKKVTAEFAAKTAAIETARVKVAVAESRVVLVEKKYQMDKSAVAKAQIETARKDVVAAKSNVEELQKATIANKTVIDAQNRVADAERRMVLVDKAYKLDKSSATTAKIEVARKDVVAAKEQLAAMQKAEQLGRKVDVTTQVRSVVESDAFKTMLAQHGTALTQLARTPAGLERLTQEANRTAVAVTQKATQAGN